MNIYSVLYLHLHANTQVVDLGVFHGEHKFFRPQGGDDLHSAFAPTGAALAQRRAPRMQLQDCGSDVKGCQGSRQVVSILYYEGFR